jgi:hypothetical protein
MPKDNHNLSGPTHRSEMTIRALTEAEIELLERSLGRPVDRNSLVHWVSQSIRDVVQLRDLPTAGECRDALLVVVREGREWVHDINHCPCVSLIGQKADLDELTKEEARVCDRRSLSQRSFVLQSNQVVTELRSRSKHSLTE